MSKIYIVFGIALFISSCASSDKGSSMDKQDVKRHWIAEPTDNVVTIIGVSNPMMRRDDEIAAAKEDAAKKAAMYYGVQGRIEAAYRDGVDFFDYIDDSRIEIVYDKSYTKYIEQLTFDPKNDVLITKEAIFVCFKLVAAAKRVKYTAKFDSDGRPVWINNRQLPQVDGYITAVGFAQKQWHLKDTIYKATEAAVARMVETASTKISEKIDTGSANVSYSVQSKGKLENFHVIEFWIEPKTNHVYTLAIAKLVR